MQAAGKGVPQDMGIMELAVQAATHPCAVCDVADGRDAEGFIDGRTMADEDGAKAGLGPPCP